MTHRISRVLLCTAVSLLPFVLSGARIGAGEIIRFTEAVNELRHAAGCGPLEWDERMAGVARGHSENMALNNFFDHTGPDGMTMQRRIRAAGIERRGPAGENISYGQSDAMEALQAWIHSPSHHETLKDCTFTHHGLGRKGTYWTHTFVTLRDADAPRGHLPPPTIVPALAGEPPRILGVRGPRR